MDWQSHAVATPVQRYPTITLYKRNDLGMLWEHPFSRKSPVQNPLQNLLKIMNSGKSSPGQAHATLPLQNPL